MPYELFDHTADLGIRVRADDLEGLFAEAATALFAAIVGDVSSIRHSQQLRLNISGAQHDLLLLDWLSELLYVFETQHLVFSQFQVQLGPAGLAATCHGEPFSETRHAAQHEVKAITYHGLKVDQTPTGWLAEVIVDI